MDTAEWSDSSAVNRARALIRLTYSRSVRSVLSATAATEKPLPAPPTRTQPRAAVVTSIGSPSVQRKRGAAGSRRRLKLPTPIGRKVTSCDGDTRLRSVQLATMQSCVTDPVTIDSDVSSDGRWPQCIQSAEPSLVRLTVPEYCEVRMVRVGV